MKELFLIDRMSINGRTSQRIYSFESIEYWKINGYRWLKQEEKNREDNEFFTL